MSAAFANPWPIFAVLLLAAAGMGAVWWHDRRRKYLAVALGLLVLALLPLAWDWLTTSPAEQIDATLDAMVADAYAGNVEGIVDRISPRYDGDRADVVATIRRRLGNSRFTDVALNGRDIAADADAGAARFVARVGGEYRGVAFRTVLLRFQVDFVNENGTWRILKVQQFPVVGDQSKAVPLGSR